MPSTSDPAPDSDIASAHDIDRRIVTVKQAGRGNHSNILIASSSAADIKYFSLWLSHVDPVSQVLLKCLNLTSCIINVAM